MYLSDGFFQLIAPVQWKILPGPFFCRIKSLDYRPYTNGTLAGALSISISRLVKKPSARIKRVLNIYKHVWAFPLGAVSRERCITKVFTSLRWPGDSDLSVRTTGGNWVSLHFIPGLFSRDVVKPLKGIHRQAKWLLLRTETFEAYCPMRQCFLNADTYFTNLVVNIYG